MAALDFCQKIERIGIYPCFLLPLPLRCVLFAWLPSVPPSILCIVVVSVNSSVVVDIVNGKLSKHLFPLFKKGEQKNYMGYYMI